MANTLDHMSLGDQQGKKYLVFGDIITIKITGKETGGHYSLIEILSPPGSGPNFLHTHPPQETFYILEGEYEIYGQNENGKYVISASPGATIHVRAGEAHGFKNIGETPGRILAMYHPADNMLEFFEDVGMPVEDISNPPMPEGPPDMKIIQEIFDKHGLVAIEPLPGSSPND